VAWNFRRDVTVCHIQAERSSRGRALCSFASTVAWPPISPELIVAAYCQGIFPMADERGRIGWYSPDPRAIFPLDAFSVEAWKDGALVGGLYGVALGGAFMGESMFTRVTDASKFCLVHLVRRLREREYVLLDSQMPTEHLMRFGQVVVPREEYLRRLADALTLERSFA